MKVYIEISRAAFTHFSNEAKEQGVPGTLTPKIT